MTKSEWIPVWERLPKKHGFYLAVTKGSNSKQPVIRLYSIDDGFISNHAVTYWMSLPEPPEQGDG